jgi:hypothetical protein
MNAMQQITVRANPMPVTTVTGATEIDVLRKGCRRQALASGSVLAKQTMSPAVRGTPHSPNGDALRRLSLD